MEIPVFLEPLPGGGFEARSADALGFTAQGDTPDAALRQLREMIATRAASGTILTSIEIPTRKEAHSYLGGGMYKNDPLYDEWRQAVEEYRQQVEDDPDRR